MTCSSMPARVPRHDRHLICGTLGTVGATQQGADRRGVGRAAVAFTLVAMGVSTVGAIGGGPSLCPVALLTGTACPGCGMTRGIVALVRGDMSASWAAHPLATFVLAQVVVGVGWWTASGRGRVTAPTSRQVATAAAVTACALIIVWLLRVTTGTLPIV